MQIIYTSVFAALSPSSQSTGRTSPCCQTGDRQGGEKKKKKRGTKNKNKKDFQIQSMSHKSSFLYYSLNNQSTSYFAVLTTYRTATILPILHLHYPFHERTIAGADFILLLFHQQGYHFVTHTDTIQLVLTESDSGRTTPH